MMNIDSVYIKSYATRENLVKGLSKLNIEKHRHLVVRNENGRYTAVFPYSNLQNKNYFPNLMHYGAYYADLGFMTLG